MHKKSISRKILTDIGLLLVWFIFFHLPAWASEPVLVPLPVRPEARVATEILVKLRPGADRRITAQSRGQVAGLGIERIPIPAGQTPDFAAGHWQRKKEVEWAQPNYWKYALATEIVPDDPYYRPERNQRQYQQWYLPKINANFAWSIHKGDSSILVAVVDSGVDLDHPDIKERLIPGITIINQENYTPPSRSGMDDNGHGTHVAGIIAAMTNNNLGISGCSWDGRIMPIKVLNQAGEGMDADIAAGITWAVDAGARIINLSLGGPLEEGAKPPQVLQDAIDYAYGHNCLVIAAAGNSGDTIKHYPAAFPRVLAIAATNPSDQRASYSTFGSDIDMAAPGGSGGEAFSKETGILSTYWNENSRITDFMGGSEAGEYAITAGTSMAAALVSGAAAVIWAYHDEWSVDQIENQLKSTAQDIGPAGADEETGSGRIDLLAALGNPLVERPELTVYNYPNPFNPDQDGITQIVFLLDEPRKVDIRIYDVSRDLVWERSFSSAETLVGKNIKAWDGRNGAGEVVANGAYFFRITTDNGPASRTKVIAVLR
ncbi:S8 family peptidase [bacterium]|nr:S8 family peptidase [bacterium]